ncbi:transcription initiation factor IIB-like [Tripterygium wilfordii]|uniref:transcription initiation factor IIB-like n=1 Tax=Tripterygium wilfordii TaxID=458696 RepID=UPI0018F85CDC|nr:transcription initiation factor IIB-like [Tripterygium wilfordii]
MDFSYCPNCKRNTETVSDYAVGDTICCECGWILESSMYVDEQHVSRDRRENWETKYVRDCQDQPYVDENVSLYFCDGSGAGAGASDGSLASSLRELSMYDSEISSLAAGDDVVTRVCFRLGMESEAINVVREAVSICKELRIDQGNSRPVLAAILYMIAQISDDQKSLLDISMATGVGEEEIKKSYKDIYPFASRIIPYWYANEEQKCRMHFANLEIAPP